MPKNSSVSTKTKSSAHQLLKRYNAFSCRVCQKVHPLRTCRKFLAMNITDRIRAVRVNKYCSNCLAHDHSQGTCFSKHGCKHCKKHHHTLLHINPRLLSEFLPSPLSSRSPSPQFSTSRKTATTSTKRSNPSSSTGNNSERPVCSTKSSTATLTSILRQNTTVLLPTLLVKIASKTAHARCLLDSGSAISRVSRNLIEKLNITSFTLREETLCPITLKSRFDPSSVLEGIFRVDNRITLHTPSESLPLSYKNNFRDIYLADSDFSQSAPIDIIIGADLYPKVLREGVFSRVGFPTAQSTMFGWTIYGPCTL